VLVAFLLSAVESPVPLEPGTWWEYQEYYTERIGPIDSTTKDLTRIEVRGPRERPFLRQTGGNDPVSAPAEQGEDWLRLGPWTGEDALPLPLETGRSGPRSDEKTEPWRVEAEEETSVPAGRFKTLRCALRTRTLESILWIAVGVGVVRETQGVPGMRPEIERVLLRWGGPLSHGP